MSPAKAKWHSIKRQNPTTIVLVRIGKFYEVFDQDAITLHEVLHAPLLDNTLHTGFPATCLDKFLKALNEAGHKSIRLI